MADEGNAKSSQIAASEEDRWQHVVVGLACSALGAGLLFWLVETDLRLPDELFKLLGVAGGLVLLFGLVVFFRSLGASGIAKCPECGRNIHMLEESGKGIPRLCRGCRRYVEARDGALVMTDVDRVEAKPIFRAKLPSEVAWPDGCCVCQAPATRKLRASATELVSGKSAGASALGLAAAVATGDGFLVVGGKRYDIAVPHCQAHSDGAILQIHSDGGLRILFRSYPFQRAFCELNAVEPA